MNLQGGMDLTRRKKGVITFENLTINKIIFYK